MFSISKRKYILSLHTLFSVPHSFNVFLLSHSAYARSNAPINGPISVENCLILVWLIISRHNKTIAHSLETFIWHLKNKHLAQPGEFSRLTGENKKEGRWSRDCQIAAHAAHTGQNAPVWAWLSKGLTNNPSNNWIHRTKRPVFLSGGRHQIPSVVSLGAPLLVTWCSTSTAPPDSMLLQWESPERRHFIPCRFSLLYNKEPCTPLNTKHSLISVDLHEGILIIFVANSNKTFANNLFFYFWKQLSYLGFFSVWHVTDSNWITTDFWTVPALSVWNSVLFFNWKMYHYYCYSM